MAEAIHCPSCSTRYSLRPERLRTATRRARCFSCEGVFPIGDIVARLLPPAAMAGFDLGPELGDIAGLEQPGGPPSLTLGDLEGADAEILEKTLVEAPAALPETKIAPPPEAPAFPPGITETTLSGYTSARDAIDKLFGDAPAQPTGLKIAKDSSMDMEATLSALEATLGGGDESAPLPKPDWTGDNPTASGRLPKGVMAASSTTVRLSRADLQAALAAAPVDTQAFPVPGHTVAPEERTEIVPPAFHPSAPAAFPASMAPEPGSEVLRLKIGEEIYSGLTMPQLIAWVEEGRILEGHLVARQQSENWLEAHKVPGLRPVFERLRRERSGGAPSLDPTAMDFAPKKSLFGGLFGKS